MATQTAAPRVTHEVLVKAVRHQNGAFGAYYGVTAVTRTGEKVWFRRSLEAQEREAFEANHVVLVTGAPELSRDGKLTFLHRPRAVIAGRECQCQVLHRRESRAECADCGKAFEVAEVA